MRRDRSERRGREGSEKEASGKRDEREERKEGKRKERKDTRRREESLQGKGSEILWGNLASFIGQGSRGSVAGRPRERETPVP